MLPRLTNTPLRLAVALLVLLALAGGLEACASSSSSPSAQTLLGDTFSPHAAIEGGNVNLSIGLSGSGTQSGSSGSVKSLAVRLSGPFQSTGAGKIPSFALKLDLTAAGHTLAAGATSTGSSFYVELEGSWFTAPQSAVEAFRKGYEQATKQATVAKVRSSFAALGIEPSHWLSNPTVVGTSTVGGVATYHLTADVNTAGFLADVSKLSSSTGALSSSVPGASALSPALISELAKSVHSAHVDIYTGKSDHLLRRMTLAASVSATPQTSSLLGGLHSASVSLDLQLTELNKPQTIAAPSNPKPFSQLLPALEQLLGPLLSGSSGSGLLEQLGAGASAKG